MRHELRGGEPTGDHLTRVQARYHHEQQQAAGEDVGARVGRVDAAEHFWRCPGLRAAEPLRAVAHDPTQTEVQKLCAPREPLDEDIAGLDVAMHYGRVLCVKVCDGAHHIMGQGHALREAHLLAGGDFAELRAFDALQDHHHLGRRTVDARPEERDQIGMPQAAKQPQLVDDVGQRALALAPEPARFDHDARAMVQSWDDDAEAAMPQDAGLLGELKRVRTDEPVLLMPQVPYALECGEHVAAGLVYGPEHHAAERRGEGHRAAAAIVLWNERGIGSARSRCGLSFALRLASQRLLHGDPREQFPVALLVRAPHVANEQEQHRERHDVQR
mmetsp:Transcript_19318/g.55035  ORF Transcript_19318/g.55035 Transcript_19318/m.55035 type:complete len:330 (-) Transcript_19318:263-1252(-)